jgi:hypothetical protein
MAGWARVATLGVITAFCGSTALAAAAAECGPHEDAERLSHRQLALSDFAGERPREKGHAKNSDSTSILITTTVMVDELAIDVQPVPRGGFVARVSHLCVRAYFMKLLSGRKSELAVNWELGHEQGHFDLTLAHARTLEAQLAPLIFEADGTEAAKQGVRTRVSALYRAQLARCQEEQDRYDRETRHGHHRRAQGRWTREIAARIAVAPAVAVVASE